MLLIGLALAMDAETAWVEGDPVAAASAWADRIDAGEVDGDLYYNLGNALYKLKRYEEAVVRLSGAIDRAPNMCEPRINRGLSYIELGKRREALDDFEVVIDLCGDSSTGAYYQAAQLLMESGDRTGACSYLRKAMGDAGGTQLGVAASDLHARACL